MTMKLTMIALLCAVAPAFAGEAPMSRAPARPIQTAFIDIPEDADLDNGSCSQAIGRAKAKKLVEECLDISSATRPPCNVANACRLMIDEIKRGCAASGNDAPAYCADFEGD